MLDYFLANIFINVIRKNVLAYESREILIKECCAALNSYHNNEYYIRVLANSVLLNCFNEISSLLLMTNYRDLVENCRIELTKYGNIIFNN